MFSNLIFRRSSFIISIFFITACYDPSGPIPEQKKINSLASPTYTVEDVAQAVKVTTVRLASPIEATNGAVPEECNYVTFLRMQLRNGPENASDVDAALMMMPGFLEGANAFLYVGKNLIYQAKTLHQKNFEVWALDRRNNCLEDLTGLNAGELASNDEEASQLMVDYYYNNKPINGKTFAGFHTSADLPFTSEFGLELDINDMHLIATTMIPNAQVRKQKLFVGGHSQGGPFSALYAGWDFDGDKATTADAGYNQIAGLFGFDTSTRKLDENNNSDVSQIISSVFGIQLPFIGQIPYKIAIDKIRKKGPRLLPVPGLNAEVVALAEAIGILADKAPNKEHTTIRNIPISPDVRLVLNLSYSRDAQDFVSAPFMTDYRFTNEALMGFIFDEHFSALSFLHVSMGHLHGGSVVVKDFPFAPEIGEYPMFNSFAMTQEELDSNPIPRRFFIGNDAGPNIFKLGQGPVYSWAKYNEIGNADDPYYTSTDGSITYTDTAQEMVDSADFAKTLFEGDSNLVEWYYSVRRLLDIAAATQPWSKHHGLFYLHGDQADLTLPTFDFIAGNRNTRQAVTNLEGKNKSLVIPHMEHMDPMYAIANQPDRYENPVIGRLIEYVIETQQ